MVDCLDLARFLGLDIAVAEQELQVTTRGGWQSELLRVKGKETTPNRHTLPHATMWFWQV
jgi:hypothetical protein